MEDWSSPWADQSGSATVFRSSTVPALGGNRLFGGYTKEAEAADTDSWHRVDGGEAWQRLEDSNGLQTQFGLPRNTTLPTFGAGEETNFKLQRSLDTAGFVGSAGKLRDSPTTLDTSHIGWSGFVQEPEAIDDESGLWEKATDVITGSASPGFRSSPREDGKFRNGDIEKHSDVPQPASIQSFDTLTPRIADRCPKPSLPKTHEVSAIALQKSTLRKLVESYAAQVDLVPLDKFFESSTLRLDLASPTDDIISTLTTRKTWYRLSRAGSLLHHAAEPESYVRGSWSKSAVRAEAAQIVARWSRRPRQGRATAKEVEGRMSVMFGWGDKMAIVPDGEVSLRISPPAVIAPVVLHAPTLASPAQSIATTAMLTPAHSTFSRSHQSHRESFSSQSSVWPSPPSKAPEPVVQGVTEGLVVPEETADDWGDFEGADAEEGADAIANATTNAATSPVAAIVPIEPHHIAKVPALKPTPTPTPTRPCTPLVTATVPSPALLSKRIAATSAASTVLIADASWASFAASLPDLSYLSHAS